ncbi:MAG: SIS domain-containing protein [Atopostipes suicloacalis]|nr:SIS domain-containing protein [Atopostipes suicloacalis]
MDKLFGTTIENFKNEGGYTTASEIRHQPSVWKDTIEIIKKQKEELNDFLEPILAKKDLKIIFSGAGTSGFIGDTVVPYVKKKTGINAQSIHTTDIVAEPEVYLDKESPTLLLSFARSGNSPESVATVDLALEMVDELYQLVITCNKDGQLAKNIDPERDQAIILPEASNDKGLAMTSSYTSMVLSSLLAFDLDLLNGKSEEIEELFEAGEDLLTDTEILEKIVEGNFKKIIYLGTGSFYGLARESSLKLLELTQGEVITSYDTPLGFRHGPKAIVGDETLIVIYLSRDSYTRQYEIDLLKEIYGKDNPFKILAISETEDEEIAKLSHYHISLNDKEFTLDKAFLGIDYVMNAQILSVLMSKKVGINPDNPSPDGNINRVVEGVTIYPHKK